MKSLIKKMSPKIVAVTFGSFVLFLFWIILIIGVLIDSSWENLSSLWLTYLIASIIISIFVSLIMYLTAKYGLVFISWCFVVLGILMFFASATEGLISIALAKYLNNVFDVNMLASSIGVIAFGFTLYKLRKD